MHLLEEAINHYIALDPEAPGKLRAFNGKKICIEVAGINKNIYLLVDDAHITVQTDCDTEPDAIISGTPAALIKLGINRDVAPLLFAGEVELREDVRLGRQFKALLADMDIDWEEHLSALVGDIAAHRALAVINEMREWGRTAAGNFADDLGEYLQEESRDVVSGAEMEAFFEDVDTLRNDAERLEAKIHQLTGVQT